MPSGRVSKTEDEQGFPVIPLERGKNDKSSYPRCPKCGDKMNSADFALVDAKWWHATCYEDAKG